MAIENMAIETCGDQKPNDENLWRSKFWQLNSYGNQKTFKSLEGL